MTSRRSPIELKLDSPKIPAGKFKKSVQAFLGVISDVTESVCGGRDEVQWYVEVKPGCALIRAFADVDEDIDERPTQIKRAIDEGLRLIDGEGGRPPYFTEQALHKVRELAALHEPEGLRVSIGSELGKREITSRSTANIDDLFKWTVRDIGTIEGRLQIIAKQKALEVRVKDEVSGRVIRCFIGDEKLEEAKEAFDRRVSVTGLISYRSDGTPVNIHVEEFFRFPLERELPHHGDMLGILGGY